MDSSRGLLKSFTLALLWTIFFGLCASQLEAATFTVNDPGDDYSARSDGGFSADGICDAAPPSGRCTLREALAEAAMNGDSENRILFQHLSGGTAPTSPYAVPQSAFTIAPLVEGDTLQIGGQSLPSVGALFPVDGNSLTISGVSFSSFNSIIFRVTHSGLLTLSKSLLNANGGSYSSIYAWNGTLNISDSIFSNNRISFARGASGMVSGGAISNYGGSTQLNRVSFTDNIVSSDMGEGQGGAIYTRKDPSSSTPNTLTIINSTFYNNYVDRGNGGAIYSHGTNVNISSSTFFDNQANSTTIDGSNLGGEGKTFYVDDSASIFIQNSIVGNDFASSAHNCFGNIISQGYNLESGRDCNFSQAHDVQNATLNLAPYNSSTGTFALLRGSPALNAGNSAACPTVDQRNRARLNSATNHCDIGAYEVVCGDGEVAGNESCDDGNTRDGDACPANCGLPPMTLATPIMSAPIIFSAPAKRSAPVIAPVLDPKSRK